MTRLTAVSVLAVALVAADPASADTTIFFGLGTASAPHVTVGGASGISRPMGAVVTGFELELSGSLGKSSSTNPLIGVFGGNFFVQLPPVAERLRLYVLGGFGMYVQDYDKDQSSAGVGWSAGTGALIPMRDWLHLRIDYRLLTFRNELGTRPPLYPHVHRVTAGISLPLSLFPNP